jgi:predicted HAD superfamily Cof-like phosphohydrolase
MYNKVLQFRKAMHLPIGDKPTMLEPSESSYFSRFILEELSEYMKACEDGDLPEAADALVDLIYVALGCAHAMGLPFDKMFDIVHAANMRKQPANNYIRSLRGNHFDIVKPQGWIAPQGEIAQCLVEYKHEH